MDREKQSDYNQQQLPQQQLCVCVCVWSALGKFVNV